MLNSLLRYSRFFAVSVVSGPARRLLWADVRRYLLGQRAITNTTIVPWTDRTWSREERADARRAAVEWLLRAQQATGDNGFGTYYLSGGWTSTYVETTGYIVPTLLQHARRTDDPALAAKAMAAADRLIGLQLPSGGWQGGYVAQQKGEVVFNSAQVVRGLLAAHAHGGADRYLEAARRGCDRLCAIQDTDGAWRQQAFMGVARVYDSYVSAPLMDMYRVTGEVRYREAAERNLAWILAHGLTANGWFRDCDNTIKHNDRPILHTIAYTLDGLLDCGMALGDERVIEAARRGADRLFTLFGRNKRLHGRFDADWRGSEHMIPTGCAQLAIVWMKLYRLTGDAQYLNAAMKLNDQLLFMQARGVRETVDTKGAIPGSFPLWGRYEPFGYPNWATKYFVDSLLLEEECLDALG